MFLDLVLTAGSKVLDLAERMTGCYILSPERALEYCFALENLDLVEGRILDVGCKGSIFPNILAGLGFWVCGIDIAPWPSRYSNFTYTQGDIRSTNFEDGFFDRITAISTIEHIGLSGRFGSDEDPDGDKKALWEMRRILKDDGRIVLSVPYGRAKIMRPWCRVYGKKTLQEILGGLRVEQIEFYVQDETKAWKLVAAETARNVEADPLHYAVALLVLSKERERFVCP